MTKSHFNRNQEYLSHYSVAQISCEATYETIISSDSSASAGSISDSIENAVTTSVSDDIASGQMSTVIPADATVSISPVFDNRNKQ